MRIGHLTDLHLDESPERLARLESALAASRAWACDHLVVTGDLTRDATDAQLARLAEAIWRAGYQPWQVTVVPGNHDPRPAAESWAETLLTVRGMQSLVATSAAGSVALIERRGVRCAVLALDTRRRRPAPLALRARGLVGDYQLATLRKVGAAVAARGIPLVVAMHHGPQVSPMQMLDGLGDKDEVLAAMTTDATTAVVLCGHDHRSLDLWGGRIFCAPAVVDSDDALRVYEVRGAQLAPIKAASGGRYLRLET